jgi:predicted Rossmann fold nucleotide-binding protein DprA/Smf involved in DNA uptake
MRSPRGARRQVRPKRQAALFSEAGLSEEPRFENAVALTVSRDVERGTARALFSQHLFPFLREGRTWLVGGAKGVDHWAIEWLLEHGEECWVVVPFTAIEQPKAPRMLFNKTARLIELNLPRSKSAYILRNRYMVERSKTVVGFWSGKPGGTISTLQYALRSGREVHAIPVPVRDKDDE